MKIIERIFEYIKYKGVTIADFERQNSLSNGYLRKMKQRNADIGETIIVNLIENCPDVSLEWFILGEGDMIKPETQPNASSNTVSPPSECCEDGVISTLKDIIKEQAKEIVRLEMEVETLKNGAK